MWPKEFWTDRYWTPVFWERLGEDTSDIKDRRHDDQPDRVGTRSPTGRIQGL